MKIAFVGVKGAVSLKRIGGSESMIRRCSKEMIKQNNKCYAISYLEDKNETQEVSPNIYRVFLKTFEDLVVYLNQEKIDHALTLFIAWKDRLKLNRVINTNTYSTFSAIVLNFKPNPLKRFIYNKETVLNYKKGVIFCNSPRLLKELQKISPKNTELLLAPVDNDFYVSETKDLEQGKRLKIAYMGRLDYGKGADIAISYMENNQQNNMECFVYAYPHKNDPFSMDLHRKLKGQSQINYVETKVNEYSEEVDQFLKDTIASIDVFILPYRFLHSTIDSPLVPMEVISGNKPFITTQCDGINYLIPDKELLLPTYNKKETILLIDKKIKYLRENYKQVQQNILKFKEDMDFSATAISNQILKTLEGLEK